MPYCIMDMFREPMNYKILKLAKFLKESENCVCVLTSKVAWFVWTQTQLHR